MKRQTKTIKVGEMAQWIKEPVAKLRPELDAQNPHCNRRDPILANCPLTSLYVLWYTPMCMHKYTHTEQINIKNLKPQGT